VNFLWRKRELFLKNLRFFISPDFLDLVISKIINFMEIKLLEPIYPNKFPTLRGFRQNIEREIFYGAK